MSLEFVTYAERPDLRRREDVNRLSDIWPDFGRGLGDDTVCPRGEDCAEPSGPAAQRMRHPV